jgi:hypothetical protein
MITRISKIMTMTMLAFLVMVASPSLASDSAKEAPKEAVKGPIFLIVTHTVADYAKWLLAFDADLPDRLKAGLKDLHVYRDATTPNDVTTTYQASDLAKAQALFADPAKAEYMKTAGVISKPDIHYLQQQK